MYTRIRLLLLICPFVFSFFFLSNYQELKKFVEVFLGTMRPRRLKICTKINSGWMYCVYNEIRLLQLIHPFSSSFFFLSNFQTLKISVTFFSGTVRPRRLKLATKVDKGCCCLFVFSNM